MMVSVSHTLSCTILLPPAEAALLLLLLLARTPPAARMLEMEIAASTHM